MKKFELSLKYFTILFLAFCFIAPNSEGLEVISNNIYVFNLKLNLMYIIIAILVTSMIGFLFKKFTLDNISVALLVALPLGIIPLLYVESINYIGNYFTLLVVFASYFICRNSKYDTSDYVYKIICIVVIIISLQVIYTEYSYFTTLSISNFFDVSVKAFMKIPIGGSNKIAAYLLPMIFFILTYRRNKFSIIIVSLAIYALLLTRSKNAILVLGVVIVFLVIRKVYKFIIRDKSVSKGIKLFLLTIVTIILVFLALLIFNKVFNIIYQLRFNGYTSSINNEFLNFIDELSSGRVSIYLNELGRFGQHMFLGNGFGYELGYPRSHNWIIELLVQRGILGFIVYMYAIAKSFKVLNSNLNDKFIKASKSLLIIIFVQGLFEITVFTMGMDFLIWSMIGFSISKARLINNKAS